MTLLERTAHRPWPIPKRPWLMTQTWHDPLFAHWVVPPEEMAARLPDGLQLDLFEGQAWIGIIPFGMSNVRLRGVVGFPTATAFPELNVRTYVIKDGIPGVWFFSLDAASALAVMGARMFFHLPYFWAKMTMRQEGEWIEYCSERRDSRGKAAVFRGRYRPTGQAAGTELERWLTERYCLYAWSGRRILRGEIHHLPWPLESAEAVLEENTMIAALGIPLPEAAPLFHFARRSDVIVWPLHRI